MKTLKMLAAALGVAAVRAYDPAVMYRFNSWTNIVPNLECSDMDFGSGCSCNDVINGARVFIEAGYVPANDRLRCQGSDCQNGIAYNTPNADVGIMELSSGAGTTIANFINALKRVQFKTNSEWGNPRLISYNLGDALYHPRVGTFFQRYSCEDLNGGAPRDCTWSQAQADCASREILGYTGYLATLTSQGEEEAIAGVGWTIDGAWLGAGDMVVEGKWQWVTGPDGCGMNSNSPTPDPAATRSMCRLTTTWPLDGSLSEPCNGLGVADVGSRTSAAFGVIGSKTPDGFEPVPDAFQRFTGIEPDDQDHDCPGTSCDGVGEDYLYMGPQGYWKSYPHQSDKAFYYLCEWGGRGMQAAPLCVGNVKHEVNLRYDCSSTAETSSWKASRYMCSKRVGCDFNDGGNNNNGNQASWSCETSDCVDNHNIADCNNVAGCHWDATFSPPVCAVDFCLSPTAQSEDKCRADHSCVWRTGAPGSCESFTCGALTSQCDCMERFPECDWINDSPNAADHHCSPKSHCPAMDIVVLVPGTPELSGQYGSYPKGHDGLIESFRDWMLKSELAADQTKDYGKRFAFVTYGKDGETLVSGAEPGSYSAACGGQAWPSLTPMGTSGALSGNLNELKKELQFHEQVYCENWVGTDGDVFLAPGLATAKAIFDAETGVNAARRKVVIILVDSALNDFHFVFGPNFNIDAQTQANALKGDGITILGINPRPFIGEGPETTDAKAALQALSGESGSPSEGYYTSLMVDDLVEFVTGFCDPHGLFGPIVFPSDAPKPCEERSDVTECTDGTLCEWHDVQNTCHESRCHQMCTAAACSPLPFCEWTAATSTCQGRHVDCSALSDAACDAEPLCILNPGWGSGCQVNPCTLYPEDSTMCSAQMIHYEGCVATEPEDCLVAVCTYDMLATEKCAPKQCLHDASAACVAEAECFWEPIVEPLDDINLKLSHCYLDHCRDKSVGDCTHHTCEVDVNGDCVKKACAGLTSRHGCSANHNCMWVAATSSSPAECDDDPCANFQGSTCENQTGLGGQPNCMLSDFDGAQFCVQKTCQKWASDECECRKDPECIWSQSNNGGVFIGACIAADQASCPELDLAVLLDGSGSISGFGRNPQVWASHGWVGLNEMFKAWLQESAPLNGDQAGTPASSVTPGLFRVQFLQFSKSQAATAPWRMMPLSAGIRGTPAGRGCPAGTPCTDGQLSGKLSELLAELTWQQKGGGNVAMPRNQPQNNFMSGWTYVFPALTDVAQYTFAPAQSPADRKKVVMIVADGWPSDFNGLGTCNQCVDPNYRFEYNAQLVNAVTLLEEMGAEIFGIVLRDNPLGVVDTIADQAYESLEKIVSLPKLTHVQQVFFNDLKAEVLDKLCDSNSLIGGALASSFARPNEHPGCNQWALEDECNDDTMCTWATGTPPACLGAQECPGMGCHVVPPAEFAMGYRCANCKLERGEIICGWTVTPNLDGYCDTSSCPDNCDRGVCESQPQCAFSTDDNECEQKKCQEDLSRAECEGQVNDLCVYDTVSGECGEKNCTAVFTRAECELNAECVWDATSIPKGCMPVPPDCADITTQADCLLQPTCSYNCVADQCQDNVECMTSDSTLCTGDCQWLTAPVTGCFLKPCKGSFITGQSECETDCGCEWDGGSSTCDADPCSALGDTAACDAEPLCYRPGDGTCIPTPCADLMTGSDTDETDCEQDPRCDWEADSWRGTGTCVFNPCQSLAACPAGPLPDNCKTITHAGGQVCVPKPCYEETLSCECNPRADCHWDIASQTCKLESMTHCYDSDVVVLIDSRASAGRQMGGHPNGYNAALEAMRDWFEELPLGVSAGSVRVGMAQLTAAGLPASGPGVATMTPTGDRAALHAALDWHADPANFANTADGVMTIDAAVRAAADAIEAVATGAPRMRVVMVMYTDDFDTSSVAATQAYLDGKDVTLVGMSITDSKTAGTFYGDRTIAGRTALRTMTNYPAASTAIISPKITNNDFFERLEDFCHPHTNFGKVFANVHGGAGVGLPPCSYWGDRDHCRSDPQCRYDVGTVTCNAGECPQLNCMPPPTNDGNVFSCGECWLEDGDIACLRGGPVTTALPGLCSKSCADTCEASCFSANCSWNMEFNTCGNDPCSVITNQTECENDSLCGWNATDPNDQFCELITDPCNTENPAICNATGTCEWDVALDGCFPINPDCASLDEAACDSVPRGKCHWHCTTAGGQCEANPCWEHNGDSGACGGVATCLWLADTAKCIELPCSDAACRTDPRCAVDPTDPTQCVMDACTAHGVEFHCETDRRCSWDGDTCGTCLPSICARQADATGTCADVGTTSCMAHPDDGTCVEVECHLFDQKCDCLASVGCSWGTNPGQCFNSAYESCPAVDLMIALTASGSFERGFHHHPNGFDAVWSLLYHWALGVPLSGEAANVNPSANTARAFRLSFLVYDEEVYVAECPTCACAPPAPAADGPGTIGPMGTADNCGVFTGDRDEVLADITRHEARGVISDATTPTWIHNVYDRAVSQFSSRSVPGRKKVLWVITESRTLPTDIALLSPQLNQLASDGVLIVGSFVWGRRGNTAIAQDIRQFTQLKERIAGDYDGSAAYSAATAVTFVTIEEFTDAIYEICDASDASANPIGAVVGDTAAPFACSAYNGDELGCVSHGRKCLYEETGGVCNPHPCHVHCTEPVCTNDTGNHCAFIDGECVGTLCEDETTSPTDCDDRHGCHWVAAGTPRCQPDPCPAGTEDACWMLPGHECEWRIADDGTSKCTLKPCNEDTAADCNSLGSACRWEPTVGDGTCVPTSCTDASAQTQPTCPSACSWTGSACEEPACLPYRDTEYCNTTCMWTIGTSPGSCVADPGTPTCTGKNLCDCKADATCWWTGAGGCVSAPIMSCPNLDVVFMFGASAEMQQEFGRYPNGYMGLTEVVREWQRGIPFSGGGRRGMTVSLLTSTGNARWPSTDWKGTHKRDTLAAADARITMHQDWIKARTGPMDTLVGAGLTQAANVLNPTAGDTDRVRAVVWFAEDASVADASAVAAARTQIAAANALLFGVALQRTSGTPVAGSPAAAAKAQMDSLADAAQSLELKDVLDKVLMDLCNPAGTFGAALVSGPAAPPQPCASYGADVIRCRQDVGCVWDSAGSQCQESTCADYCDQPTCEPTPAHTPECAWDATGCWEVKVCDVRSEDACEDGSGDCMWIDGYGCTASPCTPNADAASCEGDPVGCEWADPRMSNFSCNPKCSGFTSAGDCPTDYCAWGSTPCSGGVDVCATKLTDCAALVNPACDAAKHCYWDGTTCQVDVCAKYSHTEPCCEEAPDACVFDTSDPAPAACVTEPCSRETAGTCDLVAGCDVIGGDCMPTECSALTTLCDCRNNDHCHWSVSGNECLSRRGAVCPAMDLVFLIEGSSFMNGVFSQHPKGYYAVQSAVMDFVRELPLTGEAATVGAASTGTRSRVAAMVYRGNGAGTALTAPAAGVQLSGTLAEVEAAFAGLGADAVAAEAMAANFDGRISKAITDANTVFGSAAVGRRTVVVALAATGIVPSTARLINAYAAAPNTEAFGIAVRTGASSSTHDAAATSSLTGAGVVGGVQNVNVDELTEALWKLCDPSETWGQEVLGATGVYAIPAGPKPCDYHYGDRSACEADPTCAFDAGTGLCGLSPCAKHCDNATCSVDLGNNCHWDGASSSCERVTPPVLGCLCEDLGSGNIALNQQFCNDKPVSSNCKWDAGSNQCMTRVCEAGVSGGAPEGTGRATCQQGSHTQSCIDKSTSACDVVFECACPSGTTLKNGTTPVDGQRVECVKDDCINSTVCNVAGGTDLVCADLDDDYLATGQVNCHCPAGWLGGPFLNGPGACTITECDGTVCTNTGEHCVEGSPNVEGDYACVCDQNANMTSPAPATTVAGGCDFNECTDGAGVGAAECEKFDQDCLDIRLGTPNTYFCTCRVGTGNATTSGTKAGCTLIECDGTKCPADQQCTEVSTNAEAASDWRCECVSPQTGTPASHGNATCYLRECDAICETCENATCGTLECEDPDPAANMSSRDDWYCKCPEPHPGMLGASGRQPLDCSFDECRITEYHQHCRDQSQECFDPNHSVIGDDGDAAANGWRCICVEDAYNTAPVNEGDATQNITAGESRGATCNFPTVCQAGDGLACVNSGGHHCTENATAAGGFICECTGEGYITDPVGGLAGDDGTGITCNLNECDAVCPTCMKQNASDPDVCAREVGQECHDPNEENEGDWTCRCASPFSGGANGRPATGCTYDECTTSPCGADQTCVDDDKTDDVGSNSFTCTCNISGLDGDTTTDRHGGPADCECNECASTAAEVCSDNGQNCRDTNKTCGNASPDFVCLCPLGFPQPSPEAVGVLQVCEFDECTDITKASRCTGESPAQYCLDEDLTNMTTFRCYCHDPTDADIPTAVKDTQYAVGGPATTCSLNECFFDCGGAGNYCRNETCSNFNAALTCTDDGTDGIASLDDWLCVCPLPSTDTATKAVIDAGTFVCTHDECDVHGWRCTDGCVGLDCSQTCSDPDPKDIDNMGNWQCLCDNGGAPGDQGPATCLPPNPCDCGSAPDPRQCCARVGDVCHFVPDPIRGGETCQERPCGGSSETECEAVGGCEWYSAGAGKPYIPGLAVYAFEGLTCPTPCAGNCASGSATVEVRITDGYVNGMDSLTLPVSFAGTATVTQWDAAAGVLTLGTTAGAGDAAAALAALEFVTNSDAGTPKTLEWTYTSGCTATGTERLVLGYCQVTRCNTTDSNVCEDDDYCTWVAANTPPCEIDHCAQYPREGLCEGDEQCEWDAMASPAICRETTCAAHSVNGVMGAAEEAACNSDPDCTAVTDGNGDQICVKTTCAMRTDQCDCHGAPECYWQASNSPAVCVEKQYGLCPADGMDVMILFEGTAAMRAAFGTHSDGYTTLMATLRDWVGGVPLSGTQAGDPTAPTGTGWMRVAFAQFAGASGATQAAWAPTGTGAAGGFSGDLAELEDDLAWHEANPLDGDAYLADGLWRAEGLFSSAPNDGRKRALVVVSASAVNDAALLPAATTELNRLGVEVMGMVVRAAAMAAAQDDAAEASLRSIVDYTARPSLLANEFMDDVADNGMNPLGTLCNPTEGYGQYIATQVAGDQPCFLYTDRIPCLDDHGCDYSGVSCVPTACLLNCQENTCTGDCEWSAADQVCYTKPRCSGNVTTCDDGSGECVWVPADGTCKVNPCGHDNSLGCLNEQEADCDWLTNFTTMDEYCTPAVCNAVGATAAERQTWCEDASRTGICTWFDDGNGAGDCHPTICDTTEEIECTNDIRCQWDGSASPPCTPTDCGKYPSGGTPEYCASAPESCEWGYEMGGGCVAKPEACSANDNDECACHLSPDNCYYLDGSSTCVDATFGLCPTLDLVVLIDGSGTMMRQFGTNGQLMIMGLFGSLNKWVEHLPLSGDAAGATPGAGIRVAFVQYSGSSSSPASQHAIKAPTTLPGGAGGRFSGTVSELKADLQWHQDNFMGLQTYINTGLLMAADMLASSPVEADRKRALIILGDGDLDDGNNIGTGMNAVHATNAVIFAVVLRPALTHSSADLDAEAALKALVTSPPEEHFINDDMEDFVSNDGPLWTICDPTEPFGKHLVTVPSGAAPCYQHTGAGDCKNDPGCGWDDVNVICEPTPCFRHCKNQTACTADVQNNCEWTNNDCVAKPPCAGKNPTECASAAPTCMVDQNGDCVIDPCGQHTTDASCGYETAKDCEWISSTNTCVERPCSTTNSTACDNEAGCRWDNGVCTVDCATGASSCVCQTEGTCHNGCFWNASVSPASCQDTPCNQGLPTNGVFTAAETSTCNAKAGCVVKTSAGGDVYCAEKECNDYTGADAKCDCHGDADCYWDGTTGACVEDQYGLCPTLDLVVLFDGSGSMGKTFGNHQHGYYALIELLRVWTAGLPLSGTAAGASNTDRMRVAFIQYGGSWGNPTTAVAPVAAGRAGGRLSGDLAELHGDLDWHQNNWLTGQTYIADGLTQSALVLRSSPSDRKHAVFVISDGKLDDAAAAQSVMDNNLAAFQPEVYAIYIRRFTTVTPADAEAAAVLSPLATHSDGFVTIDMDHLAVEDGPLSTICDPSEPFGKYLARSGTHQPCATYPGMIPCSRDGACAWFDTPAGGECIPSTCTQNCDANSCNSPCLWDNSLGECFAQPPCVGQIEPDCAAPCQWDDAAQSCSLDPCYHNTQRACEDETAATCTWDNANGCSAGTNPAVTCSTRTHPDTCRAEAELCRWNGTCVNRLPEPEPSAPCITRGQNGCEDEWEKCHWDGARCVVNPSHGTCSDCAYCAWDSNQPGCNACASCDSCQCKENWFGPECGKCTDKDYRSDPNGAILCPTCSREFTCSLHGTCTAEGLCDCDAGYFGTNCQKEIPGTCSPVGANWMTTYPNKPVSGEKATLIVHGCFNDGAAAQDRTMRVVPASTGATAMPADPEAVCNPTPLPPGVKDVQATLEASGKMELMADVTFAAAGRHYICWKSAGGAWQVVPSQEDDAQVASVDVAESSSSPGAGAHNGAAAGGEACCDGWLLGSVCLPPILILLVLLCMCGGCCFMVYRVATFDNAPAAAGEKKDAVWVAEENEDEMHDRAEFKSVSGFDETESSRSLLASEHGHHAPEPTSEQARVSI